MKGSKFNDSGYVVVIQMKRNQERDSLSKINAKATEATAASFVVKGKGEVSMSVDICGTLTTTARFNVIDSVS